MGDSNPAISRFLEHVDPDALKVVRKLLAAGHEAYLVGGCVRDLYLGRRPKDFDVATSATPETIRRLFRNSRIIGRRFKLAHVFYGPKIIETSTFRTTPAETGGDDLLITHDNEWGSVEDDARRRDFTINGLFYDVEEQRIVDFVDGHADLDDGIVRTIGDPVVRFQEDPVRMIRAVKFAARLGFRIEDATWKALLEVVPDINKCSRARLLEEVYKILRSGSAHPCLRLMLEANMLHLVMPSWTELFGGDDEGISALRAGLEDPAAARTPAAAAWRHFAALDDYIVKTGDDVVNGLLQAVLFAPLIDDAAGSTRQGLDKAIERLMTPVGGALGIARRDRELARQILMAHRRMVEVRPKRRRRTSLAQRQYFHDALIFLGIAVAAQGGDEGELERWKRLAEAPTSGEPSGAGGGGEGEGRRPRRRRRRGGRKRRKDDDAAPASDAAQGESPSPEP